MNKPKIAAIIQARMGSTRLPGKVLMPLAGKPVLWHIIHRLGKCRLIDDIVVATSDMRGDDKLAAWCQKNEIPVFRGSEENVLQRFALAIKSLDPGIIIRVCGDSPMVDPQMIDHLIEHLIQTGADYCRGDKNMPSIHEGFSPFSRCAFERLIRDAANDPVAIEHVTAYFDQHPEEFQPATIPIPRKHCFSGARMSVDTPADLCFMEEVYAHLDVPAGEADVADVVRLLKDNPNLLKINSHVRQKKATDKTFKAVIRCDGNEQIGFGYVSRCILLAEELREVHSIGVSFAMQTGKTGIAMVRNAGFTVDILPQRISEDSWLDVLILQKDCHILILDIRTNFARKKIGQWRKNGLLISTFNAPNDSLLQTEPAFYQPILCIAMMDELDFKRITKTISDILKKCLNKHFHLNI